MFPACSVSETVTFAPEATWFSIPELVGAVEVPVLSPPRPPWIFRSALSPATEFAPQTFLSSSLLSVRLLV